jgi:hypothetical protein
MKHYLRLVSLIVVVVFASGSIFAQNTLMTKAQALGLKTGTTVNVVDETANQNGVQTVLLEEGFDVDGDFPPGDWTQSIFNASYTWIQSNPTNNNFDEIDPNSLFSALVPWVAEDQDEWLITPVIDAMGETPLSVDFYAGVSGPWLGGATLKCHISDDGGTTWTELWDAYDEIDPAADWAWNFVSIDISAYAAGDFQIAWQYVGNDGDLAGIDGVVIEAGVDFIFYDDLESYTLGTYLAESDETGFWTTWSNDPGSAEDALITDVESASPTQSCIVEGISDLVLLLGNKTSGVYVVSVEYYVPTGFGAYINLQHWEAPGTEWATQLYFATAGGSDNGWIFAGAPDEIFFTYPKDTWFTIAFYIDIDEDLAYCMIDETVIAEWQFSLQSFGDPGTNQLGGVNIYAGAPTGETPKYYFDNVAYIAVDPGIASPIIDVDPTSFFLTLEEGEVTTDMFSIGNLGEEELNYQIVTVYPQTGKALTHEPAGVHTLKDLHNPVIAGPNPGINTGSNPSPRDVTLHYDTENFNGIGRATDYEYRVSAMFPAAMVQPFIGMEIDEMSIWLYQDGIEYKAQIYGMGSYITPGPGALVYEEPFTASAGMWTDVTIDPPVALDGSDIWVGYWLSGYGDTYVPGVDAGPADPNGDWIATGPGWSHLSDNPDLDFNWNIRANVSGDAMIQWLSPDPTSGSLVTDEYEDIDVTIDASSLVSGQYSGKLKVRNNDPTNDEVVVSVTLGVLVGVGENGENEFIAVYPNPASTMLRIKSNGEITNVRLVNTIGQVVFTSSTAADIDISNFERGVYFIQVDTKNGTNTQKVLIQ